MTRPILNRSERRTLAALTRPLQGTGMSVSVQTRCIDVLRCFVEDDQLRGTDELGLLDGSEYSYALKAHFDFVVLDAQHVPVLAVEFDGPSHVDPEVVARDCRKNRLCFMAGLPLLRIHDAHLQRPERVNLLEWLVQLWQDYEERMPELLADRDVEIDRLTDEQFDNRYLLMDRPDLDVELIFQLEHPFPPALTLAAQLHRQHRIHIPATNYDYRCSQACVREGLTVQGEPLPALGGDEVIAYTCTLRCGGETVGIGRYETAGIYPWYPPGGPDPLDGLLTGIPAGPWIGAGAHLARGMSFHNALRDVADWARAPR